MHLYLPLLKSLKNCTIIAKLEKPKPKHENFNFIIDFINSIYC